MSLRRTCCKLASVAVIASSAAVSRADILVRNDGGLLDGKVVSKTSKQITFQPDDGGAPQHIDASTIARVLKTDEHGALLSDGLKPTTSPSKWNVPADPAAPPVLKPGSGPTYVIVPLHGEVGVTILASALEKSLEDAAKRKPTVVVLDIDSPGGLVEESKQISAVLHHYNKTLRIVALTNQDLSAAAIFSLSVREIYVKSTSTIGAATSYIPGNPNLSEKVEEKMQSAWRAAARNSAEEGRHEPLLAEAMIDNDQALHLETVNGKTVVKEGDGDHLLCRKGKILTLSSHEAVLCGLAAGEADDLNELADALKLPKWTEIKALATPLADSLPKRADAYKAEMEKIHVRLQQDLADAVANDPSQQVTESRIVNVGPRVQQFGPPGMRHGAPAGPPPGQPQQRVVTRTRQHPRSQWKSDSLNCVVSLQRAEADLTDAGSLAQAYGHATESQMLKEAMNAISGARAVVYDDRNKYGQGEVVATNDRPTSVTVPESTSSPRGPQAPADHPSELPPADLPPDQPATPDAAGARKPGEAYEKWIDDKIADLSGDSADLQNRAADQLCMAIVSPHVRGKVLTALGTHLNSTDKGYRLRCVQAYGHWASSEHAQDLLNVITTPGKSGPVDGDQDAWAAAASALVSINPKMADGAIRQKLSEFFFRVHVTQDLAAMAAENSPTAKTAIAILKRIEPNNDAVALSLSQAEELLRSDSAQNRLKGVKALTTAVVDPAAQSRVLALLKPHVMGNDGRARLPFVQAYAHWAGRHEVETLKAIIAFPEHVEGLTGQENCWAAATLGLARLDPEAGKQAMESRLGQFFYRANLQGELTKIARSRSPFQPTASWLLGEMDPNEHRPLPDGFDPMVPTASELLKKAADTGKRAEAPSPEAALSQAACVPASS